MRVRVTPSGACTARVFLPVKEEGRAEGCNELCR